MLEILEKLKDVRSIQAKALRSKIEAWLIKGTYPISALALTQVLIMVVLTKGQQHGIVPFDHWAINVFVWFTIVSLICAVVLLLSLMVIALCFAQKNAYDALHTEAKYDLAYVERELLQLDRAELLATQSFLKSRAAEIQKYTGAFYSGGAVFALAFATAVWTISKDLLGESKLRELTTAHVTNAIPSIIAFALGISVIIAIFRPLRSTYGYHIHLINMALALQERTKRPVLVRSKQHWRCRIRRSVFGCCCG